MNKIYTQCKALLVGRNLDPLQPGIFKNIALISFLAWVGLGADGLSSSCYGPAEAFLALGSQHIHLALYVALATAITVFVISLGYNQVAELFPSGGGGYKVATQLLGEQAGLVSGAALIVDYVLTIAISVASSMDAFFSFLPDHYLVYKLPIEICSIFTLTILNLRGMKESVTYLLPIFLLFVLTHFSLIIYGILVHQQSLNTIIPQAINETQRLSLTNGWLGVMALTLHAYSLGGGTYTGLEAVSNNVHRLAEPRVRTSKITMLYMAISLSFTASGILLLYLLWHAEPITGQTLNAVVFSNILQNAPSGHIILIITLLAEAGILLVAANSGFLAGPSVLANMAIDGWVPKRFTYLSNRLVTRNGIIVFGFASLFILMLTKGDVRFLVVLYSINVFLTFTLTLLGLCKHWLQNRGKSDKHWQRKFFLSATGLVLTSGILISTIVLKFREGGWITVLITSLVITVCALIHKHYEYIKVQLAEIAEDFKQLKIKNLETLPLINPEEPTAVLFIDNEIAKGMHTLLWIIRMFPNHFKNFIFLSVGSVDIESFMGQQTLGKMQKEVQVKLDFFVKYCQQYGYGAEGYTDYGIDVIACLEKLTQTIIEKFPTAIFFATKLIVNSDRWKTHILHNQTPYILQKFLHNLGRQLVILPMVLNKKPT